MTPDELRALADALPEGVHWSDPITPDMLAEAIRRFCADAQPVPAGWKLVPVEPTPEMLSAVGMMDGYDCHAPGCSPDADHATWYSAMIAAAPAAPQAEPSAALIRAYNSGYMQGHHDTVEAQFIDIHPLDMDTYHADVVAELGLTAAPQAEPMADSDADYWLRNRQPILDAIERAGFMLMSNASGFWLHPRGTTEAQIEARDALLDFISENGTASEGVQYYLDRYVRAALAAKEQR